MAEQTTIPFSLLVENSTVPSGADIVGLEWVEGGLRIEYE